MPEQELNQGASTDLTAIRDRELRAILTSAEAGGHSPIKTSIQVVDHILKKHFGFEEMLLFMHERVKLIKKLAVLFEKYPDRNLKDKVIVDLGCGNFGGTAEECEKDCRNHPWFCAMLEILGARPIGVDIGKLEGAPFEHHNLDLLKDDLRSVIAPGSADVVTADELYGSPHLLEMKMADRSLDTKGLRRRLFPQIQQILKPEGFYLEEDAVTWEEYQTVGKYDLCHEDRSKIEVLRLLESHKKSATEISHRIAHKISELVTPYMLEEFEYKPDEDVYQIIEFHCAAVLDLLARSLPDRDLNNNIIMEFDPRDLAAENDRAEEPWSSRFLGMLGCNTLLIGYNKEDRQSEQRDFYDFNGIPRLYTPDSFDAIIAPELKTLPPELHDFYLSRIREYLKPGGYCLEQGPHSVQTVKKEEIT